MNEPLYAPSTITVTDLLGTFKKNGQRLALVLDEYGEVQGIVTLSDVMQSLVGDIGAVEGSGDVEVVRRADGTLLVDGAISISRFNEAAELSEDLPGQNEGLFGRAQWISMARLGRIPSHGDTFEDRNRVDKLLITKIPYGERSTPSS